MVSCFGNRSRGDCARLRRPENFFFFSSQKKKETVWNFLKNQNMTWKIFSFKCCFKLWHRKSAEACDKMRVSPKTWICSRTTNSKRLKNDSKTPNFLLLLCDILRYSVSSTTSWEFEGEPIEPFVGLPWQVRMLLRRLPLVFEPPSGQRVSQVIPVTPGAILVRSGPGPWS